jgi:hypothetical protein
MKMPNGWQSVGFLGFAENAFAQRVRVQFPAWHRDGRAGKADGLPCVGSAESATFCSGRLMLTKWCRGLRSGKTNRGMGVGTDSRFCLTDRHGHPSTQIMAGARRLFELGERPNGWQSVGFLIREKCLRSARAVSIRGVAPRRARGKSQRMAIRWICGICDVLLWTDDVDECQFAL